MTQWYTGLAVARERIVRKGGNQTGHYVIIDTGFNLWRLWDNGHQTFIRETRKR